MTSALHMPRALAVFRSAGIKAVPAPTDVQVGDRRHTVPDVLPDAGALAGSTAAIREYVGQLVYDGRGWIDGPLSPTDPGAREMRRPAVHPLPRPPFVDGVRAASSTTPPSDWAPHHAV